MIKRKIKVLYWNKEYKLTQHGEFIDLALSKLYSIKPFKFTLIDLGVSIKLPAHYGALVIPRSSTCKNYHLIQANSVGLIENNYCGHSDRWMFPAIALTDTIIDKNTRICQFRPILNHNAPWYAKILDLFSTFVIEEVDVLPYNDRSGFGSTGL